MLDPLAADLSIIQCNVQATSYKQVSLQGFKWKIKTYLFSLAYPP